MSRRHRMICSCGHRSEWLMKRFSAVAEKDAHAEQENCHAKKAIVSAGVECIPEKSITDQKVEL